MTDPTGSVFFKLHQRLQHAIVHRLRWRELRPVQEQTVRVVQAGLNAVVLAPTAGGKTEAAMFGVLDALLRRSRPGLRMLYLSPLRALLNNQEPRLQELTRMVGFDAFKWHGDISAARKLAFARSPAAVLMTTPESLQVILMSRRYDPKALFQSLEFVVVDEIHGFAGDDRGDHLIVLLEQLRCLGGDFQRIGLSATVGNPEHLLGWLQGSSRREGEVVNPRAEPQRKIIQIVPLPKDVDPAPTAATLARGKKSLIFADSRTHVERIKLGLERSGIRAFPHHGSLSRDFRERSEEAFRGGGDCAIVATSTLELGLDVGDLDLVVQLESPTTVSAFLQRLGRSGRRPGSTARMTFLCRQPDNFLVACALVSLAIKRWVEPVELSTASYPMYVHYVLATVLGRQGATRGDLVRGEGTPYCFTGISREERESIIEEMVRQQVLSLTDSLYVMGPEGERRFGRSNFISLYSAFETPPLLSVRTAANQEIGQLEAWFVLASEKSMTFVLGGKAWQTQRVDWQRGLLIVKPAPKGAPPCWMGTPALLSRNVCREARELLRGTDSPPYLGQRGLRELQRQRSAWAAFVEPADYSLTEVGGAATLHTFAGGKINNVIARYHHQRTGEKTVPNNFFISTDGRAKALLESLDCLADATVSDPQFARMLGRFEESRLSKFQSCLPRELEARFVAGRVLDIEGARTLSASSRAARPKPSVTAPEPEFASDDPFLSQLAQLAVEERLTTKWVFVPNNRWKNALAERLVRRGCHWLNFRFVTPFQLAVDTAAPVLLANGIEPRPEGLGPAVILTLLEALPEEEFTYYRPLRRRVEILEALWEAIWELRLAGVEAGRLPSSRSKEKELKALLAGYERYLEENRWADRARLLHTALQGKAPTGPEDILIELPSALWTGLERRWLDSLPGRRVEALVGERDAARRFRVLSPHRVTQAERTSTCDRHLLRFLDRREESPSPRGDGTLNLFCAGRRDAELREVFRRIFSEGLPLDEVEIVLADPSDQSLILDLCAQLDLGCTFSNGVPVACTRVGQALTTFLDFSLHRFSVYHLRRLLLGEYVRPFGIGPVRAAQLLDRTRVTRGRKAILEGLSAARERALESDHTGLPEQYEHLLEWLKELFECVPSREGAISLAELAEGALAFLGQLRTYEDGWESAAISVVRRRLAELASLKGLTLAATDAYRHLSRRLSHLRCATDRARPGKLHVSTVHEFGLSGRENTFLIGLEEGVLSAERFECPVLSDTTRSKLDGSLVLSRDKVEEFSYLMSHRLGSLEGTVTLSFSLREVAGGEALLPGALFFSAARLLYPEVDDHDSLLQVLGEPKSLIAGARQQELTDSGWWLKTLNSKNEKATALVCKGFPWLGRGRESSAARESMDFTEYEGYVPGLAGVLTPDETTPMSVSQLQDLATCAFRTFLGKGLGVRPLDTAKPDGTIWLDAASRGSILHVVFSHFHTQLREEGRGVDRGTDLALLFQLLDLELEKAERKHPAPSERVVSLESERLRKDLQNFLSLEASSRERIPYAFEVGFGLEGSSDQALGQEEPVQLVLDSDLVLPLRGRIDRIDQVPDGFEVVDYKTGTKLSRMRGVRYDGGRLIQHALYALVAEKILSQTVVATSYYFPTAGPERAWLRFDPPDRAELAGLIRNLLAPLRTGVFPQASDGKVCRYCDYRSACLERSDAAILATLQNPANSHLEWRRRLDLMT